jgi:2-dehydro-3-deoxy-D-arabinonate dehydratase
MILRLCRFRSQGPEAKVGLLVSDDEIVDLSHAGITSLTALLEEDHPEVRVRAIQETHAPRVRTAQVQLLAPIERQEVWAAGVTYLRSKTARMSESDFSATAYDRVYDAERPELFFKALPEKVVGPGEPVGLRHDSRWSVPEPELALVLNSHGRIAGYTLGNDMSARDIEGENLLYLPQAKIYSRSCALGPAIAIGVTEETVRHWTMELSIWRDGARVFQGETPIARIKRGFDELARFLYRCQEFPHGAILLTGTGIVPPEDFHLSSGDRISIRLSGIGLLENTVQGV